MVLNGAKEEAGEVPWKTLIFAIYKVEAT